MYLFDEFDAVGGHRGATNDVAEMRRVLNSFLQFMEEPNATDSVVAGATNYPDLLDRALLRRFDLVVRFCDANGRADQNHNQVVSAHPMRYPRLAWKVIIEAGAGLSQSELARATEKAVKTAILDERNTIRTRDVVGALEERREMREAFIGAKGSR